VTRYTFPLVDLIVGRSSDALAGFARIVDGARIDLFDDETCTLVADAQTLDGDPIDHVIVDDSRVPSFLGTDNLTVLYGRVGSNVITLRATEQAPGPGVYVRTEADPPPDDWQGLWLVQDETTGYIVAMRIPA
jgi:hypothetical protein